MKEKFIGKRLVEFIMVCEGRGTFPKHYKLSMNPALVRDLKAEFGNQMFVDNNPSAGRMVGEFMGYEIRVHFDKAAPPLMMIPVNPDHRIYVEGQLDLRDAVRNALLKHGIAPPENS